MSNDARAYVTRVARVCSRLNRERARYLVVGATAMQLWGTTRATRDVDILIEPTVDNAEQVLRALATLGFGFAGDLDAAAVATRPVTMAGDVSNVDILTRARSVRFTDAACVRGDGAAVDGRRALAPSLPPQSNHPCTRHAAPSRYTSTSPSPSM